MITRQFKAMGTDIELIFTSNNSKHVDKLSELTKHIFQDQEDRFSRFKESSQLSLLNKKKTLKVDEDFFELFKLSEELYRRSQKAFNPLLSVKALGYLTSYKNPVFTPFTKPYNTDFEKISADKKTRIITLQEDQELDFGGIAKGFTVDKAVKALHDAGEKNFIINAGGDLFASGTAIDGPWIVGFEHEKHTVTLRDQALATSGRDRRKWQGENGKIYHHIVNAQTLNSAENKLLSLSILGSTTAECDAWATAAFSLGEKDGLALLESNNIKYFISQ